MQGYRQGSATARRYGLSRSLLARWRREYGSGVLGGAAAHGFVPLAISPPEAGPREVVSRLRSDDEVQIEIGLPNGRRLTIPATLDPNILARLLPVLDAS
ncbi:transposase [Mesorhizobium sp. J18]|nr:transposase [Mesorhizobium sp. J18]